MAELYTPPGQKPLDPNNCDLYQAMCSRIPFQDIDTANPHEWFYTLPSGHLSDSKGRPVSFHYAMARHRYRLDLREPHVRLNEET